MIWKKKNSRLVQHIWWCIPLSLVHHVCSKSISHSIKTYIISFNDAGMTSLQLWVSFPSSRRNITDILMVRVDYSKTTKKIHFTVLCVQHWCVTGASCKHATPFSPPPSANKPLHPCLTVMCTHPHTHSMRWLWPWSTHALHGWDNVH